jgi:CRISPR-associated protein Cas5d
LENEIFKCDVAVKLEGELACFTRPEFKVERVTYPVMTPSAARGVLEAIFWKPEIRWEVRQIWVLKPIKEFSLLRNEIDSRQSARSKTFFIEDKRQQRTTLFLKDVAYLVLADIRLKSSTKDCKKKYLEQFNRRIENGRCFHQPYLGTRECTASFEKASGNEKPIPDCLTIGNMLFDLAFCPSESCREMEFLQHSDNKAHKRAGYKQALYFTATLDKGVMTVPQSKYEELYGLEGIDVKGIG